MSEQTSTILLRKLAEAERDDPVLAPELRRAADEIEQLRESVTRLAKAVSDRESETLAVAAELDEVRAENELLRRKTFDVVAQPLVGSVDDAARKVFEWLGIDYPWKQMTGAEKDKYVRLVRKVLAPFAAKAVKLRTALQETTDALWQGTRLLERMVLDPSETTIADATAWYPQGFKVHQRAQDVLVSPAAEVDSDVEMR